jgi:3-phosphoshikimate 1-carboxyvinyltransferase
MKIKGNITLNGSKSISNRILMIQALSQSDFSIKNVSNAKDTEVLKSLLLKTDQSLLDAGEAGTTYRFMTAYLALLGANHVLMGSKRMCQRPIGLLVDALNDLGANVHYVGKEGFPPLQMKQTDEAAWGSQITIAANVSSQFISALLLLAPILPKGLEIKLEGKVISRPYIQMTLNLMEEFGIVYMWQNNIIKVSNQAYSPKEFTVEADWSAASYYYSLVAIGEDVEVQLNGLYQKSVQGDAVLVELMKNFGVKTIFNENGILLKKEPVEINEFKYDFSDCPDIAQTVAVVCAALSVDAELTGLETLTIKETDRIYALKTELEKMGAKVKTSKNSIWIKKGIVPPKKNVTVSTYNDHRMAMSFAPLALIYEDMEIENKEVVEKSYPKFWEDFALLGL